MAKKDLEELAQRAWEKLEKSLTTDQRIQWRDMFRDGSWIHGGFDSFTSGLNKEQYRLFDEYEESSGRAYKERKKTEPRRGYSTPLAGLLLISIISMTASLFYSATTTGRVISQVPSKYFDFSVTGFLFLLIGIIAIYFLMRLRPKKFLTAKKGS